MQLKHGNIEVAQSVAAGDMPLRAAPEKKLATPAHCRIAGILRPGPHSEVAFEVWLPQQGWNGRHEASGNGGFAGRLNLDGLAGAIARGLTETVRAVLWYSDLEGFTRIADTAPSDALLALLNDYAEAVVTSVQGAGGQVLKFIGDGVLAMFPLGEDTAPCSRALDAAEELLDAVDGMGRARRQAGLLATDIHVALHLGEVLYGNIGSRDRLDFTVVGPAVNEVARIESLCRSLEQRVIVSSAFAAASGKAHNRLVSLGRYALKGVRRPEELFTLDRGA